MLWFGCDSLVVVLPCKAYCGVLGLRLVVFGDFGSFVVWLLWESFVLCGLRYML